jgi:hypothetical protein
MGRLVVVQQAMSDRAAAGVDGAPTATAAGDPAPVDESQWPPPPPGLAPPQVHIQPHWQARQAEAVRHQIPILHRLATPSAAATASPRPGTPFPTPLAATAMTSAPARAANPFTFTAPSYRPQVAQAQQVHPQYWQQATEPQMSRPRMATGIRAGFRLSAKRPVRCGIILMDPTAAGRWREAAGKDSSTPPPGAALQGAGREFLGNQLLASSAGG